MGVVQEVERTIREKNGFYDAARVKDFLKSFEPSLLQFEVYVME